MVGNGSANSTEMMSALSINGSAKISLTPGSGFSAIETFASLAQGANTGSVLFRGTNLGSSTGTFSQVKFTAAPTLVGGAYATFNGTAGVGIINYAFGDTSATGTGTGLVTYDSTGGTGVGVRLLTAAEYNTYTAAGTAENAKIILGGTITGKVVNSLTLENTSNGLQTITIADGSNLAPTSGTFFFSGNATNPITLTKDTAGVGTGTINLAANTSANIFVTANTVATVNAPIQITTAGALVKDGAGTLVLNQNITTTTLTADTAAVIAVNGGTLKAGAANIVGVTNLSTGNYINTMTIANGGTFDMNGNNQGFGATRGKLGMALGSIVTNTGANATITPFGSTNLATSTTQSLDGTFTDGTPGDGASSGLISLTLSATVTSSRSVTLNLSHGGHTFNNVTIDALGSDKVLSNFTSLSTTDSNTIYGTITLNGAGGNTNGFGTLTANTVSDGTTVAKTLGNATIIMASSSGTSGGTNDALNIRVSGANGILDGTTSTWTNAVTLSAANVSRPSAITLDRNDGVSANFTHQMGNLTMTGATRQLDVAAGNGTTLEFTGTTLLNHTSTATDTFNVTAGTLKLNAISQSTGGAKTLTKSGAGTLLINGTGSYTGATNVNAGILRIASGGTINTTSGVSIGAGEFNYNSSTALSQGVTFSTTGGTLSGTGTITPAVVITNLNRQTSGTSVTAANPTAVIGKETFTTSIDYQAGSIFEWNLSADTLGTRGAQYDAVDTASLLNTGADATFRVVLNGTQNFSEAFWNTDRSWADIFHNGVESLNIASIFGTNIEYYNSAGLVSNGNGTGRSFTISGTTLSWSAVPEPSAALAGLLIGAGLLRRRRR